MEPEKVFSAFSADFLRVLCGLEFCFSPAITDTAAVPAHYGKIKDYDNATIRA